MIVVFCAAVAYLLGSIPFGKIVARRRGVDIQKKGSGNIGFTNSLRVLGLKRALLVLLGDTLKGFIPTWVALRLLPLNQALIVAFIAILAHVFPVWLKFKGGKGVATGLGVTLALNPVLAAGGAVIFLIMALTTRVISLSSILTTWFLSFWTYFFSPELTIFYLTLAVLETWTHRGNINRLTKGTEPKIFQ